MWNRTKETCNPVISIVMKKNTPITTPVMATGLFAFKTSAIPAQHAWRLICLSCLLLGMVSHASWDFNGSSTNDTGTYSSDWNDGYGDWGGGWLWQTESAASGTVGANSGGVSVSGSTYAAGSVFTTMNGNENPTVLASLKATASYSWSGVPGQQTPVEVAAYASVHGELYAVGSAARTIPGINAQISSVAGATGIAAILDEDGTNVFKAGGTAEAFGKANIESATGNAATYDYWLSGGSETHDTQSDRTHNGVYYFAANYSSYGEYYVEFDDTYEVSDVGLSFTVSVDLSSGVSAVASGVSTEYGNAQAQGGGMGEATGSVSVSVGL